MDRELLKEGALVWVLWSPVVGRVLGTVCKTRKQAETLLGDRIANGVAFPAEAPMHVYAVEVPLQELLQTTLQSTL